MLQSIQWIRSNKFLLFLLGLTLLFFYWKYHGFENNSTIRIRSFELQLPAGYELHDHTHYGTIEKKLEDGSISIIAYECAEITNSLMEPESEFIKNKEWSYSELTGASLEDPEDISNVNSDEPSSVEFSKTFKDEATQQWYALFYLDTLALKIPISLPDEYNHVTITNRISHHDEYRLVLPKSDENPEFAGLYIHPLKNEGSSLSLSLIAHAPTQNEIALLQEFYQSIQRVK